MKKNLKLATIIVMIFVRSISAQHSENFKRVTANFKPSDTTLINTKYKNGNKKEFGFYYTYISDKYKYERSAGKHTRYYYSGGIMTESYYDNFGILLKWKHYNSFGVLMEEIQTLSIDTNEKDLDTFLNSDKSHDIIILEKKYEFSPKICGWFLFKEGKRKNGKKIGKWIKYDPYGDIKKIKEH